MYCLFFYLKFLGISRESSSLNEDQQMLQLKYVKLKTCLIYGPIHLFIQTIHIFIGKDQLCFSI